MAKRMPNGDAMSAATRTIPLKSTNAVTAPPAARKNEVKAFAPAVVTAAPRRSQSRIFAPVR